MTSILAILLQSYRVQEQNVNSRLCVIETCIDPVITPSAYTTSDAVISSESVFIVELSLACANGAQVLTPDHALYRVIFYNQHYYPLP